MDLQTVNAAKPLADMTGTEAMRAAVRRLEQVLDMRMRVVEGVAQNVTPSRQRRAEAQGMAIAEGIAILCADFLGLPADARMVYSQSQQRIWKEMPQRDAIKSRL